MDTQEWNHEGDEVSSDSEDIAEELTPEDVKDIALPVPQKMVEEEKTVAGGVEVTEKKAGIDMAAIKLRAKKQFKSAAKKARVFFV